MHVELVTPAAPRSQHGNRVTAERWAGLLRELGHSVDVTTSWSGQPRDVLVALHARRSAAAVREFRSALPGRPVVLALTGTDLYADLDHSPEAQEAVRVADALVVLQQRAYDVLDPTHHAKVHVVHQSVRIPPRQAPRSDHLEVLVLAHLRAVKDPFVVVEALRRLPASSRVRVTHLGAPMDDGSAEQAQAAAAADSRYRWRGDVPRAEALQQLADSDLLVLTSRLEGGANAVSEAVAAGVPVVSTRIDGSLGLLGDDYPGYVEVGDAAGLAGMLERVAEDDAFRADLTARVRARQHLFQPDLERQAWARLFDSVLAGQPAQEG